MTVILVIPFAAFRALRRLLIYIEGGGVESLTTEWNI